MFLQLLIVTFAISLAACFVAERLFSRPITAILKRIIGEELNAAWQRYIRFAIYVVGISGGVRIWDLEKYITPRQAETEPIVLNAERWTLEVYRTVIGTLQSLAWMLLVFFVFALVAYVVIRGFEILRTQKTGALKGLGSEIPEGAQTNGVDVPVVR